MAQSQALIHDENRVGNSEFDLSGRGMANIDPPHSTPDCDILLNLLSRCLPLTEAAVATVALIGRYGNYAEVIATPFHELRASGCIGEHGANLIRCVHMAAIHLAAAPLYQFVNVSDWKYLSAYLNTTLAREREEVFRVLLLDSKNHLILDQIITRGGTRSVNVSIRDIVKACMQFGSSAILLLHNHPSGNSMPSSEDLITTRRIEDALSMIEVLLHDHIIVGRNNFFSYKKMSFIPRDAKNSED